MTSRDIKEASQNSSHVALTVNDARETRKETDRILSGKRYQSLVHYQHAATQNSSYMCSTRCCSEATVQNCVWCRIFRNCNGGSARTVTWLGLDDWGTCLWFLVQGRNFPYTEVIIHAFTTLWTFMGLEYHAKYGYVFHPYRPCSISNCYKSVQ